MRKHDGDKCFARKLIRPFGAVTSKDIENERKAITKLSGIGKHENIVDILGDGELGTLGYHYIDMELCDMDLNGYILRKWSVLSVQNSTSQSSPNLVFVSPDCGLQLKLRNTFTIVTHIANGLEFAHRNKLVHRDLKPANVLYSPKTNSWKIADFGFTSHAQSNEAVTSLYARGTSGYRAPELIIGDSRRYTYAVDVWALGCIFYELITHERAFKDEYNVQVYHKTSTLNLTITTSNVPDVLHSHFSEILQELLHLDFERRPKITELSSIFQSYLAILNQDTGQSLDDLQSIPHYPQWKKLMGGCRNQEEVLDKLDGYYHSINDIDGVLWLSKGLICRYPSEVRFQTRLQEAYQQNGDWDAAIIGWKHIVNKHPTVQSLQDELADALKKKGDAAFTRAVWEELVDNHPGNPLLNERHLQAVSEATATENKAKQRIEILQEMIDKHPNDSMLRNELKLALIAEGKKDNAIAIWKDLVDKHPDVRCLQVQLKWACDANADIDQTIGVWMELVSKHPDGSGLQKRLRRALKAKGDPQEAVTEWEGRSMCMIV